MGELAEKIVNRFFEGRKQIFGGRKVGGVDGPLSFVIQNQTEAVKAGGRIMRLKITGQTFEVTRGKRGEGVSVLMNDATGAKGVPLNDKTEELWKKKTFFEPILKGQSHLSGCVNMEGGPSSAKPERLNEGSKLADMIAVHVAQPDMSGDFNWCSLPEKKLSCRSTAIEKKGTLRSAQEQPGMVSMKARMAIRRSQKRHFH